MDLNWGKSEIKSEEKSQSLDLKYRPREFKDVLGNNSTINLIKSLIESESFPQFSIFSGPPGSGKTTTAFLVAKALKCDTYNGKGICGYCEHCKDLEEVLYETGKGNPSLGVNTFDMGLNTDEQYLNDIAISIQSGALSGKKIMIIEELQRTKKDAQESLLNTLEFIPEDVYIIVTTSEINKIIQALRTRANNFKFNYPNTVELKSKLRDVIEKEHIKITMSDIDMIIKQSNNNPRQIYKHLETVKSSGNEALEYLTELKAFDYEGYFKFFESIDTGLVDTILFIEELDSKVKFLQNLKFFIKDSIVVRYSPSTMNIKKDVRDKIIKSLAPYNENLILKILDDLTKVGYVSEADASVKLLTIANKFNESLFRTINMEDDLKPSNASLEMLEPEIEVISKTIRNTSGNINLNEL